VTVKPVMAPPLTEAVAVAPLPPPPDPALFERNLEVVFKPNE